MATRNFVPRSGSEGQIGTAAKPWGKVVADTLVGSISGSATSTGSFGTLSISGEITAGTLSLSNITASGDISSSATITGKKLFIDDDIFIGSSTDGTAPTAATRSIRFGAHTNDDIFIQGYHSTHNNGSHLRLAVRDDGSDSIRIETVGFLSLIHI